MSTRIVVALDELHRDVAPAAAAWARTSYPDVEVLLQGKEAILSSNSRKEGDLDTVWLAAIANELSFLRHQSSRKASFDRLFG